MSAAVAPRSLLEVGEWWQLPSGRTVVVRRLSEDAREATVRYVDENGALANGEFDLRVSFILRGRKVGHE